MAIDPRYPGAEAHILHEVAEAEGYVAAICFKTGPPALIGAEMEWTVHDRTVPDKPLDPAHLRQALGSHAPPALAPDSPHLPLPGGGYVTVEPGGQVEISSAPAASPAALRAAADGDIAVLVDLLAREGLALGRTGIDPYRTPHRVLDTPRYAAMQRAFDQRGPHGRTMMCCTAGLQVCLDAGEPHRIADRWAALHALGPVLLATFATARHHAGHDTRWESARMRAWLGMDPAMTGPAGATSADPAAAWARYAMAAPVVCVRRPDREWDAPPGITFADWINGALPEPPTTGDLDYHLGLLFPPVRPRGYLEVRFLDAQPADEWFAPVAVVAALLGDDRATDAAREACEPVAGRWIDAARRGLADPAIARAARGVLDVTAVALHTTDLDEATRTRVVDLVTRRLADQAPPPARSGPRSGNGATREDVASRAPGSARANASANNSAPPGTTVPQRSGFAPAEGPGASEPQRADATAAARQWTGETEEKR
jgi:glutamate--cysteine ligase